MKKGIQVNNFFVTAQVTTNQPLKEFDFKKWAKTPRHGFKSIQPIGDNSCPSALGQYHYEVEFCQQGAFDPQELQSKLSQFAKG